MLHWLFMRVTLLGSGGWEGIPVPFCSCRVCADASVNPVGKNARSRPEILVETDRGKFLFEISPDIRLQSARFGLKDISHFLVSHWHFDHLYGLLELHAWSRFTMKGDISIYGSGNTGAWMEKSFAHVPKKVHILSPFVPFDLMGVRVTPFPVHHMRGKDGQGSELASNNTFGYLLEHGGNKVAYLADYYSIPPQSMDLISGADVLIADGTYLFEEHFPPKAEQLGEKDDPDHLHGKNIIDLLQLLNPKKVVFHSITHLSELSHEEMTSKLPQGFYLGFDGMIVIDPSKVR